MDLKHQQFFEGGNMETESLGDLLYDFTTKKNIVWATDEYGFKPSDMITVEDIALIKPRYAKNAEQQKARSKNKAEVFTPAWIVNEQLNLVDGAFFGRENVFNVANGKTWKATEKIDFKNALEYGEYIRANRLEITCGEAPYITTRYEMETGKEIPVKERVGILDRKLRAITENEKNKSCWIALAMIALQSVYGYDYSGDNVYLARCNVLETVKEHYKDVFNEVVPVFLIADMVAIIAVNIFQMNGLSNTTPTCTNGNDGIKTKIYDWANCKEITFESLYKKQQLDLFGAEI